MGLLGVLCCLGRRVHILDIPHCERRWNRIEQATMAACVRTLNSKSFPRTSGAPLGSSRVTWRTGRAFSPVAVSMRRRSQRRNSCAVQATVQATVTGAKEAKPVQVVTNDGPTKSAASVSTKVESPKPASQNGVTVSTETTVSITVVGASGDLAKKKIFPALFALYYEGC